MNLFFIFLHLTSSCEFRTEFSECFESRRQVLVESKACPFPQTLIIPDLDCTFACPAGSYLAIDPEFKTQKCLECEPGSYSIGGGIQISSWNLEKHPIISYCWVLEPSGWEYDKKCTGWHSSEDEYLVTGKSYSNSWYETAMIFYPHIVKPGTLRVSYRKEANVAMGQDPGEFMIFINDVLKHVDVSSHKLNWLDIEVSLPVGVHEVEFVFSSYVTDHVSEIQIKEVQIRGTQFASTRCEVCEKGSNERGSDACKVCGVGSYLNGNKCEVCPEGTAAREGSVGVESCVKLEPCTVKDFHFAFSDCREGLKNKIFEWNFPLMCDNEGQSLPSSETVDCTSCPQGQVYQNSTCKYCPAGQYPISSASCEACKPGTYAEKHSYYEAWDKIPHDMLTGCSSGKDLDCGYSWEPRGSFIETSPFMKEGWTADLQKLCKVIQETGLVEFSAKTGKMARLKVFVDGHLKVTVEGEEKTDFALQLGMGSHYLKWSCEHMANHDHSCIINSIKITGSEDGGAAACKGCPAGSFSPQSSEQCTPCPSGSTSTADNSDCAACEGLTFSSTGGPCTQCQAPAIPDAAHQYCYLPGSFNISSHQFLISKLSGTANQSSYCKEAKLELSCYQTFYGPVLASNESFYVSAGRPSVPDFPSFASISQNFSYIFGILDKNKQKISPDFSIFKQNQTCEFDYSRIIVNLGSAVKSFTASPSGFSVLYENGDLCNDVQRFEAQVDFQCDKQELEGWPIFVGQSNCKFLFMWPTVHACPVCESGQVSFKASACEDNRRTVHRIPGSSCVLDESLAVVTTEEKCKSGSFYTSAMFVTSAIIAVLMVVMVGLMCYLTFRTKFRYQRLDLLSDTAVLQSEDASPRTPETIIKAIHQKFPSFGRFSSRSIS